MTTTDPRPAGPRWTRAWITLAATVAVALAADLLSKRLAFRHIADMPVEVRRDDVLRIKEIGQPLQYLIPEHAPVVVVPHVLELKLVLNAGAIFGVGAGMRWLFVGVTAVALGVALWVFRRWTGPRDRWAHIGLGLIVAGGVGNLYDRIVFACVRDFLHPLPNVPLPFGLSWPGGGTELWPYVSNVADAQLIAAIVILLVCLWRDEDRPGHPPRPEPKPEPEPGTAPAPPAREPRA
jgi:signal peptidase II